MGYQAQVVEHYNSFSKKRVDLFQCIDIVACHSEYGILGVQATTGSNHAAHFKKMIGCPIQKWLEAGAKLELWSWSKMGKQGERKVWKCRMQKIKIED